ncbi:MAG: CPBP family intramembrane glutamic endopeptidase [Terracidiphilus sp.]|jgi:membrane protease YdiL (CAAX protease family)
MDPEIQPSPDAPRAVSRAATELMPERRGRRDLRGFFFGSRGLRAGWSVLIFFSLSGFPGHAGVFYYIAGNAFYLFHLVGVEDQATASSIFFSEMVAVLAMAGAAAVVAFVEGRRSLLAFNLTGPRRALNFLSGFAAGFLALSALMAALDLGGWMRFGPAVLSGARIFDFGVEWAAAFLLVGLFEEGTFRCYLQFTLTRGINFWWAAGANLLVCLSLAPSHNVHGVCGVYAAALLGLLPCWILEKRKTPRSGFWQAAWVTSTLFASIHTTNPGENWIGIFAAALIGFVFCVSVYVTGSAWWAIGCHAAWDWAETFFYGTADSGFVAPGHYLTTSPVGNALWSGGADGPEGSLLVLGVILLLLAALLMIYGRRKPSAPFAEEAGG